MLGFAIEININFINFHNFRNDTLLVVTHNICMITVKIWERRIKKGMSLRDLEKMTGISRATINRIENGKTSPTLNQLEAIALALGCRLADLYDSPLC